MDLSEPGPAPEWYRELAGEVQTKVPPPRDFQPGETSGNGVPFTPELELYLP